MSSVCLNDSFLRCRSLSVVFVFFFKQKTAYEMRISDWSSDVCSSDLLVRHERKGMRRIDRLRRQHRKNLLVEMVLQPGRVFIAKIARVQHMELRLGQFLLELGPDFLLPGH